MTPVEHKPEPLCQKLLSTAKLGAKERCTEFLAQIRPKRLLNCSHIFSRENADDATSRETQCRLIIVAASKTKQGRNVDAPAYLASDNFAVMLTTSEFEKSCRENWTSSFPSRLSIRATHLYAEIYGESPPKFGPACIAITSAIFPGVLEQAYPQLRAAEKPR